ncbi:MAG: family 16 glycosylhydrolase [Flavobacteriales bacterium]|jgi:beta-glucanase (GH16 family)|tara:strand:+ start:5647 stop:7263 length:1617 start_codon:yes stop_codon:yes gene_type:complete
MRTLLNTITISLFSVLTCQGQNVILQDDFEGNGSIDAWYADACILNSSLNNPVQQGINTSATVLEYKDQGGEYANIRFDVTPNFDLSTSNSFSLKLYVPSMSITGTQINQISLKLQSGNSSEPWTTQSEIIKPINLDEWQELIFDFENDAYINFDNQSIAPSLRTDFNRVVIQLNGEGNTSEVVAYIDDFYFDGEIELQPVFNQLVWSDEFDATGAVNSEKWFHQTLLPNGQGWYNSELQHYTNRLENSIMEEGLLKIKAIKEPFNDQGQTKEYTSARLNSKFAFKYGRIEVRAKLPFGQGTWPAIWTLGKNITEPGAYWEMEGFGSSPWPNCGEIDIMEHWGNNQNFVQSATHTPSSYGGTINHGGQYLQTASTEFHNYSMEWTEEKLVFSVDGNIHFTYNPPIKNSETWPFYEEQYLLLNVAIAPDISLNFVESALEIDYVRVYQSSNLNIDKVYLNLTAYPNPIEQDFTIEFNTFLTEDINISLYSIDGKILETRLEKIHGTNLTINNLSYLPSGTYLVLCKTKKQTYTFKVFKK